MPDLLLEFFSEEIPARMQAKAAEDLRKLVTDKLVAAGLTYEGAKAFATPRRLALTVQGVPVRQPDVKDERKGPKVGAPEQAIAGFLRAAGLKSISEAKVQADKKGDFYVAVIEKAGKPAIEVIAEIVPEVVRTFPWPKSMRWGLRIAPLGAATAFHRRGVRAGNRRAPSSPPPWASTWPPPPPPPRALAGPGRASGRAAGRQPAAAAPASARPTPQGSRRGRLRPRHGRATKERGRPAAMGTCRRRAGGARPPECGEWALRRRHRLCERRRPRGLAPAPPPPLSTDGSVEARAHASPPARAVPAVGGTPPPAVPCRSAAVGRPVGAGRPRATCPRRASPPPPAPAPKPWRQGNTTAPPAARRHAEAPAWTTAVPRPVCATPEHGGSSGGKPEKPDPSRARPGPSP